MLLGGTLGARAESLVPAGAKGVIAPPTVLDVTGDGEPDVVVSTFDGRLVAVDGARLGLFVSRGIGAFPKYVGPVHRLHDASDGRVLYESRDPNYPAGAPLAVDLTGDGVDEPIFFTQRFPAAQGSRAHVLHLGTRALTAHDFADNVWSTPALADARKKGTLELIALAWREGPNGTGSLPDLEWQLLRLDLSAAAPASRTWAGYMGTNADGVYAR